MTRRTLTLCAASLVLGVVLAVLLVVCAAAWQAGMAEGR